MTGGNIPRPIPKIFLLCDQPDTAPVWGYILREQGLTVLLETSVKRAVERWPEEISDLVVLDIETSHQQRMQVCRTFRQASVSPILLLLPVHHETQILDAYSASVDDVIVKPVSPAIFLAKALAWVRRAWSLPMEGLELVRAGRHVLDPARRAVVDPSGVPITLTGLEFRLLHLLMSRPGQVFKAEEIIRSIWGGYADGDQGLLKNVVYRLRRKIEADPARPVLLQTWPGGYSFHG